MGNIYLILLCQNQDMLNTLLFQIPLEKSKLGKILSFFFQDRKISATVRIAVAPSRDHYTLKETLKYLFFGREASSSFLSGTVTSHGVLTNAHGFFEEIPSFRNKFLNFIRSEKLYYRPLVPLKIEQGLTLKHFNSDNEDFYYRETDSNLEDTIHNIYTVKNIKSVLIAKPYIESQIPIKTGGYFGKTNPLYDLAIIKYEEGHNPLHICQITKEIPSSEIVKVKIYQYPSGHPLQKMSEEYAHFSCEKHPYCYTFLCEKRSSCSTKHHCITLPGSSGSSLRDAKNGEIIGVHRGGYVHKTIKVNKEGVEEEIEEGHNTFVPLSESIIKNVNYQIYPQKEIDNPNK
jgi:hypothetical protein